MSDSDTQTGPAENGSPHTTIGTARGTALMTAAVLGPGILSLPAIAYNGAGPAFLIPLLVLLALSIPLALTFAALGRAYPSAGGIAGYVHRSFGRTPGAIVGYLFYFGVTPGMTGLGLIAGSYVSLAIGGGIATTVGTAAILLTIATLGNLAGIRTSATVQLALTLVLLLVLWASVAVAAPQTSFDRLEPFAPHGWVAVGGGFLVLAWTLTGWEASANLIGTLRNPQKDLRRITWLALGIVIITFIAFSVVMLLSLAESSSVPAAPLGPMLAPVLGNAARFGAAAVAVILTLANMNAYLASLTEVGTRLTEAGFLPRMARTKARARRISTLIPVAIAATLLALAPLLNDPINVFVSLSAAAQVPVLLLGVAAALHLFPRRSRAWAGALLVTIALAALLFATWPYILAPIAIIVIAVPILNFTLRGKARQ